MPDFQRDITLTGGSNDYFVAPGDYDYWLYNTTTNGSVTISRSGKAPILISAGEVFIIHLGKGEEIALSGTAGNTISILDHADVKLIPAAKDVLGKFILTDGLTPQGLGTFDNQKQLEVSLYDSAGNALVSATSAPGGLARGLVTRLAGSLGASTTKIGNVGILDASQNAFSSANRLPVTTVMNTLVEGENLVPTSVAGATVETVEVAGTNALALGTRIFFTLSAGTGVLTTAANVLTYIAIKYHTNAVYGPMAFLGSSITGSFDLAAADTLDIVVRNQDTVAHGFAASWYAMTP